MVDWIRLQRISFKWSGCLDDTPLDSLLSPTLECGMTSDRKGTLDLYCLVSSFPIKSATTSITPIFFQKHVVTIWLNLSHENKNLKRFPPKWVMIIIYLTITPQLHYILSTLVLFFAYMIYIWKAPVLQTMCSQKYTY